MKELRIEKNDSGQRVDRFVGKCVPSLPSSLLHKYIRTKRIKVNSKGTKAENKLCVGDTVQLYINDEFFETPNEENEYLRITSISLDIVYEDENILLVNKKAGVLCHSNGEFSHGTLIAMIQAYLYAKREWRPREENSFAPALCNRIDRNTQGIVIAAKNAEALRILNDKIKNREIDKFYLAAVHGRPEKQAGQIESYIFKDAAQNQVYVSKKRSVGAKLAVTEYKTIASSDKLSLVECRLITGRTHQIRAQLASIGHPLLGDGKYGSERQNKPYGERFQALCSYRLIFTFKTDGGALEYLNGKEFKIGKIDFIEKYFNFIDI